MSQPIKQHPASFRDPCGFMYEKDAALFRFVAVMYKEQFHLFQSSGLAQLLVEQNLLLPFTELNENHTQRSDWFTTLQPQQLTFLSYQWEWSFEQLKDAASVTLTVCRKALEKGMVLKDATPLNIQFVNGKAQLIDHLSFETYEPGTPWIAYRQFCECFLNPLLLASYCRLETHRLCLSYPDGVPMTVTSGLLPFRTRVNTAIMLHVHLHAKMSNPSTGVKKSKQHKFSTNNLLQILESLETLINSLHIKKEKTNWSNYYDETILSKAYFTEKKQLVQKQLAELNYQSVFDAGANEGEFSLLCKPGSFVAAADADSTCINQLYLRLKEKEITHIHPLVIDLIHPSPATGWINLEQSSFTGRMKYDLCLALAFIHHLCIGKNLPFEKLASFFAVICGQLVIEFVPKSDPKVQLMLETRKDIFEYYTQDQFEIIFSKFFEIQNKTLIKGSERSLYLMKKKV